MAWAIAPLLKPLIEKVFVFSIAITLPLIVPAL
jgi:hypothetical protein